MKYELDGTTLRITAESTDDWKGSSTAQTTDTANGIPVLRCGTIRNTKLRKDVTLCIRFDTRPGLAALISQWESNRAARRAENEKRIADEEAQRIAELKPLSDQADREFAEALGPVLSEIGDGVRIEAEHDSGAADGWGSTDYRLDGEELTFELRQGIDIHLKWVNSLVRKPGWTLPFKSELVAWVSIGDAALLRERIADLNAKREAVKVRANQRAVLIEAKRAEVLASGQRLATPKQLGVISRARDDWFDLFDGCGSFGMHGTTDEDLETMTIEKASELVGAIIAARKAGE